MKRSFPPVPVSIFSRRIPVADPMALRSSATGGGSLVPCQGRGTAPAFTLIELLAVVAVITILAGITLAALGGVNEKAARDRARTEIAAIANALESYRAQRGDYPPARGSSVPYSDIAAYLQISGGAVQGGQLTDPYGNPYVYILPGQRNPASFDLFSQGKDRSDTNKFIGNW